MKETKPNNNKIRKKAATMPMSIHNSVSGLFASGIVISCFFANGGGLLTFFLGIIDTQHGTNEKSDYTADNNTY